MAAQAPWQCEDKIRLLAEYNRGVLEWSKAVRNLIEKPGDPEFPALLLKVDEARARTQLSKSAYNAHVAKHGC
jgi:hypothetical protein